MYIVLIVLLVIILGVVGYSLISTYIRLARTYRLAHGAPRHSGYFKLGDPKNPPFKLLILGDSIGAAFGVPEFEQAVGTRMAAELAKNIM